MALIPGSIPMGSMIAPTDDLNTYAVHEDMYNRGGYRTVQTNEEMQQITRDRRKVGMMVYVVTSGKAWVLTTEPHTTYGLAAPGATGDTHLMAYAAYGPTSGGFAGSSFNISMGQSNQAGAYTTGGGDDVIANTNSTGNWTEFEPGGGGGEYTQSAATESTTGGIVTGETFTAVSTSDMFDSLLYGPDFETFGLTGYTLDTNYTNPTIIVEAKTTIPANTTFEWSNINDVFINPTTVPSFTVEAITDATDLQTNPTVGTVSGYPGTYTSSNTILNLGGVAGPGAENEGIKDYKVKCVSVTNQDYEKSLRIYWRHKWLIGSCGDEYSHFGMQFEPMASMGWNPSSNTLANLESGSGNQNVASSQCNSDVSKYILDPLNFDYSTWYPVVETLGANTPHWIGLYMPKDYWQLITGQAFVAGQSTIGISYAMTSGTQIQKGLIMKETLYNHYNKSMGFFFGNMEQTENGTDYIGFCTDTSVCTDAFKIDCFNS